MRKLAILCAAAAASAGLAQALADPPARKSRETGNPNQIMCRSEPLPGSLIKGRRLCLTRAQWSELRAKARELADEIRRFKQPACTMDPQTGMAC